MKKITLLLSFCLFSCILFGQTNRDYIIDSKGTKYEVEIIRISADSVISFTIKNAPGKIRNIRIDHIKEFYLSDQSKWSTNTFDKEEHLEISNNKVSNINNIDGIYLMERAHGLPRDHMLQAFLESNGIDANSSLEFLHEAITFYNEHEAELLFDYDVERHKSIVAGVSQARAARQAQWGQALTGVLSGVAQAVDVSQQQAKAEREAKRAQAERDQQQKIQERNAANQQAQDAARQSAQDAANRFNSNTASVSSEQVKSKSDLYTSDPSWNKAIDLMVQQHGLEKTAQIVQQRREEAVQESTQASQQSYEWQQNTAQLQNSQLQNAQGQQNSRANTGSFSQKTIISAITTSRTQIYITIERGIITCYATRKDDMGRYNWNYGNYNIRDIKYSPYYLQFRNEYSKTAIIDGVGHVFFN